MIPYKSNYSGEYEDRLDQTLDGTKQYTIKVNNKKEIQQERNKILIDLLIDLRISFEKGDIIELEKSLISTKNFLDEKHSLAKPTVFPESHLLELMQILLNVRKVNITYKTLSIFSSLIANDESCVQILLKNSFLDVLVQFREILVQASKDLSEGVFQNMLHQYLTVILSLLETPEPTCSHIASALDFGFVLSLFDFVSYGKVKTDMFKLFTIYVKYPITVELTSLLIQKLHLSLIGVHDDSYGDRVICNLFSSILDNNNPIDWSIFQSSCFPQKLIEFIHCDDYNLIKSSADCIRSLALQNFYIPNFGIDDVLECCLQFDHCRMYQSLFCTYATIAERNKQYVDAFFVQSVIDFIEQSRTFSFCLKKEIAFFIGTMIGFASQIHVPFIMETKMLKILYEIIESHDEEGVKYCTECLLKVAQLISSSQSAESIYEAFHDIVSPDILNGLEQDDDFKDFPISRIVVDNYPFIFGVFLK